MLPEKWQELIGKIKDEFTVEETDKIHLDEEGGIEVEYIIFQGPLGRMKLEFITRPVVLGKKTKYSNRLGAETIVDYIYSPDEKTNKLKAYKWDEAGNNWVEMEAKNFNLS